ncbi:MAG: hypothetical protein JNM53_02545 [Gemmatimonadetes bacterium]|nr:hypothetical protein [Gemmatimonadota bacterium]
MPVRDAIQSLRAWYHALRSLDQILAAQERAAVNSRAVARPQAQPRPSLSPTLHGLPVVSQARH